VDLVLPDGRALGRLGVHGDVHCVQVDDLLEADCDDVGVASARVRVGEEPGAHGVGGACEVKLLGVDVPCGALDVYRGELCEFGLAGCELLQDPSLSYLCDSLLIDTSPFFRFDIHCT